MLSIWGTTEEGERTRTLNRSIALGGRVERQQGVIRPSPSFGLVGRAIGDGRDARDWLHPNTSEHLLVALIEQRYEPREDRHQSDWFSVLPSGELHDLQEAPSQRMSGKEERERSEITIRAHSPWTCVDSESEVGGSVAERDSLRSSLRPRGESNDSSGSSTGAE